MEYGIETIKEVQESALEFVVALAEARDPESHKGEEISWRERAELAIKGGKDAWKAIRDREEFLNEIKDLTEAEEVERRAHLEEVAERLGLGGGNTDEVIRIANNAITIALLAEDSYEAVKNLRSK